MITPPERRSSAAPAVIGVLALLAVLVAGVALFPRPDRGDEWTPPGDQLVEADVARDTPAPRPDPLPDDLDVADWAPAVPTTVPTRALQAYAAAELAQRAETPDCGLSWTTIAGIGRVESDHGQLGRADLDADGGVRPQIIGIALDGTNNTREIRDTDGGALDGDTEFDRAVGPMQFLPTTWARYGADGNGDGVRDPHQLDDAALAAAAYLCADDRDTASGEGWWDAVLTYNNSLAYGRLVWAATQRYAVV